MERSEGRTGHRFHLESPVRELPMQRESDRIPPTISNQRLELLGTTEYASQGHPVDPRSLAAPEFLSRLDSSGSLTTLFQHGVLTGALRLSAASPSPTPKSPSLYTDDHSPSVSSARSLSSNELRQNVEKHIEERAFHLVAQEADSYVAGGGVPIVAFKTIASTARQLRLSDSDYALAMASTFKIRMLLIKLYHDQHGGAMPGARDAWERTSFHLAGTQALVRSVVKLVRKTSLARNKSIRRHLLHAQLAFDCTQDALSDLDYMRRSGVSAGMTLWLLLARRLLWRGEWHLVLSLQRKSLVQLGYTNWHLLQAKALALLALREYRSLNPVLDEFAKAGLTPKPWVFDRIIHAHLSNCDTARAKETMNRMAASNISPTSQTVTAILEGSHRLGMTDEVRALTRMAAVRDNGSSREINAGLRLSQRTSEWDEIYPLLEKLDFGEPQSDGVDEEGGAVVGSTKARPTAKTFAVIIEKHAERNDLDQAVETFCYARRLGVQPSQRMTTALLKAFIRAGELMGSFRLIKQMCRGDKLYDETATERLLHTIEETLSLHQGPRTKPPKASHVDEVGDWTTFPLHQFHFTSLLGAIIQRQDLEVTVPIIHLMKLHHIQLDSTQLITFLRRSRVLTHRPDLLGHIFGNNRGKPGGGLENEAFQVILSKQKAQAVETSNLKQKYPARTLPPKGSTTHVIPKFFRHVGPQFHDMNRRGVQPDRMYYALRIRREAVIQGNLVQARAIFDDMVSKGMRPQQHHYAALMEGHARHGDVNEAKKLMREYEGSRPPPDELSGTGQTGDGKRAVGHVLLWTILILGFGRIARPDQSRAAMEEMIREGVRPDLVAVDTLVNAYWKNMEYAKAYEAINEFWPTERVGPLTEELKRLPTKKLLVAMWKADGEQIPGEPPRWRGFTKKERLELVDKFGRVVTAWKGDDSPKKTAVSEIPIPRAQTLPRDTLREKIEQEGRKSMPRYQAIPWSQRR